MVSRRSLWLWVAVLAVAILAGFSHRFGVASLTSSPNVWDVAIPVQADLYLLAYLFIPVWVVQLSLELPNLSDESWLVRCGSRLRWLTVTGRWAFGQATGLLVVWLIASLVLSAGLPLSPEWSHLANPDSPEVVIAALQTAGTGAIVAWGVQWLAYLGLFMAIFAVLAVANLALSRPSARYIAAVGVWMVMVFAIRGGLNVNSVMFVYGAAANALPVWLPVLAPVMVIAVVMSLFSVVQRIRRAPQLISLERFGLPGGYLIVVVLGLVTLAINLGDELTLPDLLHQAFYGFDSSSFNAGVYALFLITFSGFTLVYMVGVEQRLWPLYLLVSIRSGSPRRWMLQAYRDITAKAAGLILTLTAVAIVIVAVSGHPLRSPDLWLRMWQFTVNGTLQLLVATGLVFLLSYLTRSRTTALVAIGVLAVIQIPMININQILPFGLNALGLATDWPTVLSFTLYLSVATATIIGLSLLACTRRTRHILERIAA